jgi:endoglucanase
VTGVGGIDRRVLLAQPVIVHGQELLPGLIGSRPPHVLPAAERKSYPSFDDLVVDTGLSARQVEKLVRVGDPVTFDQRAVKLNDGWISGKAMDNRASVACMTRLLELLRERRPAWDVLVAATVQEEVGLKGGLTVGYHTEADLAVVVDTTWGIGVGVTDEKGFKLGDGPTLGINAEVHPALFEMIQNVAKELELKLAPEVIPGASGTEAQYLRIARSGIPTAIVSIPIRNMHTPVEVVATKDIERAARIIAGFVATLDDETLDRLALEEDDS